MIKSTDKTRSGSIWFRETKRDSTGQARPGDSLTDDSDARWTKRATVNVPLSWEDTCVLARAAALSDH